MKLLFLLTVFAMSCGKLNFTSGKKSLGGSILPLSGITFQAPQKNSFIQSAYAAIACDSDVYARLYKVKSDGTLEDSPLASTKLVSNRYTFSDGEFPKDIESLKVSYQVEISGCDEVFYRPITGLNEKQDVTYASTLLGLSSNTVLTRAISEVPAKEVEILINLLSGSNLSQVYNNLDSNTSAKEKFREIFNDEPVKLVDSRPTVNVVSYPVVLNEGLSSTFKVSATHFHPGYTLAYEWQVDGTEVSISNQWVFSPNADSAGTYVITSYVGASDGTGHVDRSKPFVTLARTVEVYNVLPAVAPDFNLLSTATNNGSLTLKIQTGTGKENCDSFQSFLITTSTTRPLPSNAGFTRTCTVNNEQDEIFTISGDGTKTISIWAKDRNGLVSDYARTKTITLDTTPPVISLSSPTGAHIGGSALNIILSATDATSALSSIKLQYAADGTTFSDIATLTASDTSYSWTIPTQDTATAKLRLFAQDAVGNSTTTDSNSFTIDSTPPAAPSVSLASGSPTKLTAATFTIGSCFDRAKIFVSEGASAPSGTSSGWQTCSTAAGAITHTLTSGDGTKNLTIWSQDSTGLVSSTSATASIVLDQTGPTIAISSSTSMRGGQTSNFSWTVTEANAININSFTIEFFNGVTWSSLGTLTSSTGNLSNQLFTLTGASVPYGDTTDAKIRVTYTDAAGNTGSATGTPFTLDSTVPSITSFTLAGGATAVAVPSVSFTLAANDSLSGPNQMRLSESSAYADNNWINFSTSGFVSMSAISGPKTIYLWVKDNVGNVSAASSYAISLDYGSPPTVSIFSPTTSSGPYTAGVDNVNISWSCSSANGLAPSPVRIKYTADDGLTFNQVSDWTTNNLSPTTGDFNWTLPNGVTAFRLLVECKSEAGVVASSYSPMVNTPGWSIYAGDPGYLSENVNANLAVMINGGTYWQSLATDSAGNIYFVKGSAIMKADSQTGLITRFAGDPNGGGACNLAAGSDPLTSANNKIGSSAYIIGTNQARDSLILSTCSMIWQIHTTTRAVSVLQNSGAAGFGFFSKTGIFFYYNSNRLYSLDLNSPLQTPVHIYGDGTCSETGGATGTDATLVPVQGAVTSNTCSENYVFTNQDNSKIWVGCWNGFTGCSGAWRLDYNSTSQKYTLAAKNLSWGFGDWDIGHCTHSYVYNRVWCNSRWTTGSRVTFNLNTESMETRPAIASVFIRYAPSPTGMVSLSSGNILNSYYENSDGTITTVQIGGSSIESFGNGSDNTKVAFSAVDDITYSSVSGDLMIRTSGGVRRINMASFPTLNIGTYTWTGAGSSTTKMTLTADGSKVIFPQDWCGVFTYSFYSVSGLTVNNNISGFFNALGCNSGTRLTHPIADGTAIGGNNYGWEGLIGSGDRPLLHTNGKFYFFVKNASSNAVLYSSDRTTLKWIAGRSGANGYDALDNGNSASLALLNDVRWIMQITSGPRSGDLLILDGSRLRMITISSNAAAPLIYDILNLESLTGFPVAPTINDFAYDSASELFDGTNYVPGTGKMYVMTTANALFKIIPTGHSGTAVTSATLSQYSFSGTSLSGNSRIALTPAGLLVTQPSKQRILRVAP